LQWYSASALTSNNEVYNESLEISRFVRNLPKVKRPTETKTAIFYSDYDRWALLDRPLHAAYSIYSILGEHNGNWFRFVSKNTWQMDGIKLLYIPRMRFTDPDLTAKVKDFVKNGGTAVIFDPDFMLNNIDGSAVPERAEFIGTALKKKSNADMKLTYNKSSLALSKLAHVDLPEIGTIYAYDFAKLPAGAKVLASYGDGKPAIIERAFGKGKVIFSAVMPFGTSAQAIEPGAWKTFFADQAKKIGEKTNLDIWFFELPEVKNKHFNIKPLK
jgi:beta-galactosidase GanA